VDDNKASREILDREMKTFSFLVTTVASGQEAIDELEKELAAGEKQYDLSAYYFDSAMAHLAKMLKKQKSNASSSLNGIKTKLDDILEE